MVKDWVNNSSYIGRRRVHNFGMLHAVRIPTMRRDSHYGDDYSEPPMPCFDSSRTQGALYFMMICGNMWKWTSKDRNVIFHQHIGTVNSFS